MNHNVLPCCMQRSRKWGLPNWIGLYLPPLTMPMEGKGSLKCVTLFSEEIFYRLEHERSFFPKFITTQVLMKHPFPSNVPPTDYSPPHLTSPHSAPPPPQKYISPKLWLKIVNLTIYNTPLKKIPCPGNGERNLTILIIIFVFRIANIILYLTRSSLHLID